MNDMKSIARQLIQEFGQQHGQDVTRKDIVGGDGAMILIADSISIVQNSEVNQKGKKVKKVAYY